MSKDLQIRLKSNYVNIENGQVTITIGMCSNIECINIGFLDIGPDITINLREILGELNEKAREEALNAEAP